MTNEELLAMATCFEVISLDRRRQGIRELKIELRTTVFDSNKSWAVVSEGFCLNRDGYWVWEPRPSSREDDFLQRCRWSDLHEVVAYVQEHMRQYPSGYKPEDKNEY